MRKPPLHPRQISLQRSTLAAVQLAIFALLIHLPTLLQSSPLRINFGIPEATYAQPIVRNAVDDAIQLLQQACQCPVARDLPNATVDIRLPQLDPKAMQQPSSFAQGRDYPYFHYPLHNYIWASSAISVQRRNLSLQAATPQGLSCGIYGLLQEHLGFRFVHPRQTVVPDLNVWPLPPRFTFAGTPRFDKKGFHLHTQHPLELTEPLHNPAFPNGLEMVQEYLQWLARNGQNYFEFCLLEGVDLPTWVPYARKFVAYAHARGILCSVDLSLHMLQQQAYKLVRFPPVTFKSFEKQIDDKLELLLSADWDFVNMEFSMAEFVGGLEKLRHRLRDHVVDVIAKYPGVKLMGRQHVVKPEDEIGGNKQLKHINGGEMDTERGILIHTVMCYSITDETTPVYELDNFDHLYAMLIAENKRRETWYYPESAYWITFDNSVPMLLLPYLSARLRDIETMEKLGIPGHVTFSSGWEWGYWLVDWSIARWSWNYTFNQLKKENQPLGPLFSIGDMNRVLAPMTEVLALQERHFLGDNYLRYLCPENVPDEFPAPGNKQFQPRAEAIAGVWAKDFPTVEELPELYAALEGMPQVAGRTDISLQIMEANLSACCEAPLETELAMELLDALRVTNLRLQHRTMTLSALGKLANVTHEKEKLPLGKWDYLNQAHGLRLQAQALVNAREAHYRYPLELIARPLDSYTSYDFGYLYTVSDLFWWQREEEQIRQEKFGPFFMNPWDLAKIVGAKK